MKEARALRLIEKQLVLEQGDCFDIRRNIPIVVVLAVSSMLFILTQFFPQVFVNL